MERDEQFREARLAGQKRDFERALRFAGWSRREACVEVSRLKREEHERLTRPQAR